MWSIIVDEMENTKQLKAIKRAMAIRGWSQGELARQLDYSPAHISRILNGTRRIGARRIIGASKLLNIPVEELLS